MITVRNYRGSDTALLPEIWNRALYNDMVSREHFIRKLLMDINFVPAGLIIAEDGERIAGFISCVRRHTIFNRGADLERGTGYINAFVIDPDYDTALVGNMLIDAEEEYFRGKGVKRVTMGYYPIYFTQGINEETNPDYVKLFESRGYKGARSYAQDIDLTKYSVPERINEKRAALEEKGFYIGALKDEYIVSFLDIDQPFSSPSWSFEFRERLIRNLDLESVRVCALDGRVVGACAFGDPNSSPERFGPFGVDDEFQGMGIGSVLLSDALVEMKRRSLHNAWTQWTSGSSGGAAGTVYSRAGFRESKSFLTFGKTLD